LYTKNPVQIKIRPTESHMAPRPNEEFLNINKLRVPHISNEINVIEKNNGIDFNSFI